MKKIAILGSTGSIGTQTLEVVRENGDIEVLGLAAGSNISLLEEQIRVFQPKLVAVWDEKKAAELKIKVQDKVMLNALKKNPKFQTRRGPVVLVILDGVGFG